MMQLGDNNTYIIQYDFEIAKGMLWSQKILKKFVMSGIYGKIIPNMEKME